MTAPVAANYARAAGAAADTTPTLSVNGARLERLRPGRADEPLFIVPGLEGDPDELTALASALIGPQEVYAVAPLPEDSQHQPVVTVERMAQLMVAAIRTLQPCGPYRLGGYSFGALVALEMAQQLRASGEVMQALFLIEAVYDERYWPRGIWLRALVRRTGRQLVRIVRMRPTKAVGEFGRRGIRLIKRVMRRNTNAPDPLRMGASDGSTMLGRANSAIAGYRPRFYDGRMTLIASSIDRHFGCDTVRLWVGYADRLDIRRVDGDHLTVMRERAAAAAVASVIDHQLATARDDWTGVRPMPGFERPMILSTMRWFSAARLAHALLEAGFTVSACRPRGHALEVVEGLTSQHRINRLWRMRSLVTAIRQAKPDIILPDDERALVLLRRLHTRTQTADPEMAALVARSLGNIADRPLITSRTALANVAQALDISAPATSVVGTADALREWSAHQDLPFVLKTDGSWGGRGVAIVRARSHLRRAWRATSNPPRVSRALKRFVFNLEAGPLSAWVRRVHPVVNAQQFVDGREAIVTVACVDGAVLALVCLEVIQASEARGPAAVVRVIDHPAMANAARRLVGRFGLSGFCGFDFIITDADDALLLELNPRVTPTCYLLVEGDYLRYRTIALFPAELVRSPDSTAGSAEVLDTPVRVPALIHHGERTVARQHRPVARLTRRVKRLLSPSR